MFNKEKLLNLLIISREHQIDNIKMELIPSYLQKKKQEIYNEWINSEEEKIFNLMKNATTE